MAVLEPYKGNYYLWKYLPSLPGAIVSIILFILISTLQAIKFHRTRAWFCIWFLLGCILQVLGYLIRTIAHTQTSKLLPFLFQNIFILLGPALYAGSIYMTLGHLLRFLNAEHHSPIPAKYLTKAFILGDWTSFMIQGNSAGLTAKQSTQKIGEVMIIFGLMVQVVSFGLFFLTAIVVHRRINRNPTSESLRSEVDWRSILWMLYGVSVLILLRSIFRLVEYAQGINGWLFRHEWTLYVFDTVPMFVVAVAFWYWYPSEIRTARSAKRGPWWRMGL